ncbi:VWA domain-containing protein [Streptosporangium sp. CA-115845]|uniref:VWA domain-containing protein n=1 Tax=Streptosporangium sp. CA-115845 TaxID=3240071 RepID=UPI003D8BBAD5
MIKRKPLTALKDLAARAGRWLGLAAPPTLHTSAIASDPFDEMAWRDTYEQAGALRDLAYDLADRHDHTDDLLRDVWSAAYKAAPQLRPSSDMDRSSLLNHRVVSALLGSADFTQLRNNTVGDPYAAAMAVLAQSASLRAMLEETRQAQQAAQAAEDARQLAAQAAHAVQDALQAAAAAASDGDGGGGGGDAGVPDGAEQQVAAAIAAAEAADQAAAQADVDAHAALAEAGPRIDAAARAAAAEAAQQASDEADVLAAWGVQAGQLQRMSFEERSQLAQRLAGNRLAEFAALIGRFRAVAKGERASKVRGAPGELVGVTLGDDLSRLVPSELAALAVAPLRADFVSRLAERRLMTYETRGEDIAGEGAIIACVDCSGSMESKDGGDVSREAWAKACALALLDQARASRRTFVGVLFASAEQVEVFTFREGRADLEQVLAFAERFFGGGTSFQAPLDAAADVLQGQYDGDGTRHGDIVLITDGECGVDDDWMAQWRRRKALLGHRVFGVTVTTRPSPVLEELCDTVRTVTDLADLDTAADLFRLI